MDGRIPISASWPLNSSDAADLTKSLRSLVLSYGSQRLSSSDIAVRYKHTSTRYAPVQQTSIFAPKLGNRSDSLKNSNTVQDKRAPSIQPTVLQTSSLKPKLGTGSESLNNKDTGVQDKRTPNTHPAVVPTSIFGPKVEKSPSIHPALLPTSIFGPKVEKSPAADLPVDNRTASSESWQFKNSGDLADITACLQSLSLPKRDQLNTSDTAVQDERPPDTHHATSALGPKLGKSRPKRMASNLRESLKRPIDNSNNSILRDLTAATQSLRNLAVKRPVDPIVAAAQKLQRFTFKLLVDKPPVSPAMLPASNYKPSFYSAMQWSPNYFSNLGYATAIQNSTQSQTKTSFASTSEKLVFGTFKLGRFDTDIQDYTKFCKDGNKIAQDPMTTSKVASQDTLMASRAPTYQFTSTASKTVARRNARLNLAKKGRRRIIDLQPKDDSPMIIAMRKQSAGAKMKGSWRDRMNNKVAPKRGLDAMFPILGAKPDTGRPPKRKLRSPHYVGGNMFIAPQEYALLEKKICGEHRSKKLCNGHGRAPRTPSKQMIWELLSVGPEQRPYSCFSEFLSPQIYGTQFMKSIPRTLTRFTCFSSLPREIQSMVWEHALPVNRLCVLRSHPNEGLFEKGVPLRDSMTKYAHLGVHPVFLTGNPKRSRTAEEFLNAWAECLTIEQNLMFTAPGPDAGTNSRLAGPMKSREMIAETFCNHDNGHWVHYWMSWSAAKAMSESYGSTRRRVAPVDAVSALLQTCQTSRKQVLLSYEPAFERQDGSKQYCNFKNDAVYLHFSGHEKITRNFPQTRQILDHKSRLRENRMLLTKAINQDFSKVRHLVLKDTWIRANARAPVKWAKIAEFLSKRFTGLERITVDVTNDLDMDLPAMWDPYTQNCNLQRWLGEAWFAHLPLTVPNGGRCRVHSLSHYDLLLDEMKSMIEKFPDWNPVVELRELACRNRDMAFLINTGPHHGPGGTPIWNDPAVTSQELILMASGEEWTDEDDPLRQTSLFDGGMVNEPFSLPHGS